MSKQVEFGDKNSGTWGTIKIGRKGWTVETFSRYQGTRSGSVVFVPFEAPGVGVDKTDELDADYNGGMSNGDAVRVFASTRPDLCVVRKQGNIVQ